MSDTAAELPVIEFIRGDSYTEMLTFEYTEIVLDDEDNEFEVDFPYDLTVYEDIVMDVRRKAKEDSDLMFTLSLSSGLTIDGDYNNKLLIHISNENSNNFVADYSQFPIPATAIPSTRVYYRDIRFVLDGNVSTLLKGTYKITHNVTAV